MKQFKGCRDHDDVLLACKEKCWPVDTTRYDRDGSDFIRVDFSHEQTRGWILLSTFNGRFFGETTDGVRFTSDNADHDGEPWFDELLNVALIPQEESV